MSTSSGIITLDQLLGLNLREVRLHLESQQPPNIHDPESVERYYQETQGTSRIIYLVDEFMAHPLLIYNIEHQVHLSNLRSILAADLHNRFELLASVLL